MGFAYYLRGMSGNDAGIKMTKEVFMTQESKAEKARRALSETGSLCYCMQPVPEPGTCCGTIMRSGKTVSFVGKKCARCKGLIPGTVH